MTEQDLKELKSALRVLDLRFSVLQARVHAIEGIAMVAGIKVTCLITERPANEIVQEMEEQLESHARDFELRHARRFADSAQGAEFQDEIREMMEELKSLLRKQLDALPEARR